MIDSDDISDTILAKSDQLNACDLFAGPITVTVQMVDKSGGDQPVSIHIGNGMQPFKPCLGMRRVLAKLWGKYKSKWIGRTMTLYCDDSVTWAGSAVGGIRISHMSHIDSKQIVVIRASKHKTISYEIYPLTAEKVELPAYSDEDMEKNETAWADLFMDGKSSPDALIAKISQKFTLTDQQKTGIKKLAPTGPTE